MGYKKKIEQKNHVQVEFVTRNFWFQIPFCWPSMLRTVTSQSPIPAPLRSREQRIFVESVETGLVQTISVELFIMETFTASLKFWPFITRDRTLFIAP
jgi:hypothetical protein